MAYMLPLKLVIATKVTNHSNETGIKIETQHLRRYECKDKIYENQILCIFAISNTIDLYGTQNKSNRFIINLKIIDKHMRCF